MVWVHPERLVGPMGILHEAFGDSEESRLSKEYQDQFFNDNLYSNFGDLGQNIRKYVQAFEDQNLVITELAF